MTPFLYADHAATTPLAPEALEAMLPFLKDSYGNPSSLHSFSRSAKEALAAARAGIAGCIGAQPDEIFFTSGGTESDNWALKGTAIFSPHCRIITDRIEHHAVLNTAAFLKQHGWKLTLLPSDTQGHIPPDSLARRITHSTKLVSIMLANNEIGTIEDIPPLAAIAHEHGVTFHTDAVQAVGHIPVNVNALGVDLLSASAHKFNGPKGIGFLYVRKGTPLGSLMHGGQQEFGFRAGTENVAAAAGMAAALQLNCREMQTQRRKLNQMTSAFCTAIRQSFSGAVFSGDPEKRLPGHVSLALPGVSGEAMLHLLDLHGIAVSTGAACNSRSTEISHVLKAIRMPGELSRSVLRISFGRGNEPGDALTAAGEIIRIASALQ